MTSHWAYSVWSETSDKSVCGKQNFPRLHDRNNKWRNNETEPVKTKIIVDGAVVAPMNNSVLCGNFLTNIAGNVKIL